MVDLLFFYTPLGTLKVMFTDSNAMIWMEFHKEELERNSLEQIPKLIKCKAENMLHCLQELKKGGAT